MGLNVVNPSILNLKNVQRDILNWPSEDIPKNSFREKAYSCKERLKTFSQARHLMIH